MADWKYICLDLDGGTVVLFPPTMTHADVAARFQPSQAESAGFVRFDETSRRFVCYGRSESLKLTTKADDAVFVNRLMARR